MPTVFIFLILLFSPFLNGQLDCNQAPTPAMKIVCNQIKRWDEKARTTPTLSADVKTPGIMGKAMAAEFSPIASNVFQCMDIACLCVFFRGTGGSNCQVQGRSFGKAVRKEYRMLTDDERQRLHTAFRTLKQNGEYDRLARVHSQYAESGAAHSGPAFLPWHREFIKRIEFLIRQVDPTLHLPYWDSTLDQNLPDSKDSIMWTNEFMGEISPSGQVLSGPFRSWPTIENKPTITRAVGKQGKLYSEDEIQFMMNQNDIAQVMSYTAPQRGCPFPPNFLVPEYTHGNPHIYVGGDMLETQTAANDPVFWLHHSFVDHLWEMYRVGRQTRAQRETVYPADNKLCSSEHHFRSAFMRPFTPMRNADGLSNMYTDNLYSYAPRPSCNTGPDCGSPYLFCDRSHGAPRCAARMRPGGNCASFTAGEPACYQGTCQGGKCVAGAQVVTPPPTIQPTKPVIVVQATCFNENECCAPWAAKGECNANPIYMNVWCKASCRQCTPNYDLNNECLDRHANCATWSRGGECAKNPLWMSENCRQACGKCGRTRAATCGGAADNFALPPATPPPAAAASPTAKCDSPMCFNEDQCCPVWAQRGQCQANPGYMMCQCKVSCGACRPPYQYGVCADYHADCASWASRGECGKNKWMPENCRKSCNTCITAQQLAARCVTRMIRSVFLDMIRMR